MDQVLYGSRGAGTQHVHCAGPVTFVITKEEEKQPSKVQDHQVNLQMGLPLHGRTKRHALSPPEKNYRTLSFASRL